MPPSKKPTPAFEVLLVRKGLYPERVPVNVLTQTLKAANRLSAGAEGDDEDENEDEDAHTFGLVHIRRGSAGYQFASPPAVVSSLQAVGEILRDPDAIGDRGYLLYAIERFSEVATSLRGKVLLKAPGKGGEVYAEIDADSYETVAGRLLVSGETTVFGKIERVGGVKVVKCALRLDERHGLLYCRVAIPQLAQKLGERLYQRVAARGVAKWLKTNWRLLEFEIVDVTQPERRSAGDVIAAFRAAGASDWDGIEDPHAFLADAPGDK